MLPANGGSGALAQPSLGGVLPSGGVEAVRIVQGGAPTAFVPSLPGGGTGPRMWACHCNGA